MESLSEFLAKFASAPLPPPPPAAAAVKVIYEEEAFDADPEYRLPCFHLGQGRSMEMIA